VIAAKVWHRVVEGAGKVAAAADTNASTSPNRLKGAAQSVAGTTRACAICT
jgi:hypothetical protein